MARLFQRWKPKMLRMHYSHYAPTSVKGQITFHYSPDPTLADDTAWNIGMAEESVKNSSNFLAGDCYEDFCFQADLSGVDKSKWYNIEIDATPQEPQDSMGGVIGFYTSKFETNSYNPGDYYLEGVFEFTERKVSAVDGADIIEKLNQLAHTSKLSLAEKRAVSTILVQRLFDQKEAAERKKHAEKTRDEVLDAIDPEVRAYLKANPTLLQNNRFGLLTPPKAAVESPAPAFLGEVEVVAPAEESSNLDPCYFCRDPAPDHLGRDCPKNPKKKMASSSKNPVPPGPGWGGGNV
jgi:hypothetical protein